MQLLAASSLAGLVVLSQLVACGGRKDWSSSKFRADYLNARRADSYPYKALQPSLEAAALALANQLSSNGSPGDTILSETEFLDMYWPNLPEQYNNLPHTTPQSALSVFVAMRDAALSAASVDFYGETWTKAEISFRAAPEDYGAVRAHFPETVVFISASGRKLETTIINVILEHKSEFKVARLAPM